MFSALLLFLGVTLVLGNPQVRTQDEQLLSTSSRAFECLEDGIYEDPEQCDKYWVCEQGFATPRLCGDGLVFDILKGTAGHNDPCDSPYVVDCGNKHKLQEPQFVSDYCPRKNGVFEDPDPTVCTRYYTCINGVHLSTDCNPGLHFDVETGLCNYPKIVGRSGCVEKTRTCVKKGAFCCTGEKVFTAQGLSIPHPSYPDLEDCQKFYVCLNGIVPQESSCSLGQVYNEKTTVCDFPENVPECYGWYRDHPQFSDYYVDNDTNTSPDIGNQDTPN